MYYEICTLKCKMPKELNNMCESYGDLEQTSSENEKCWEYYNLRKHLHNQYFLKFDYLLIESNPIGNTRYMKPKDKNLNRSTHTQSNIKINEI